MKKTLILVPALVFMLFVGGYHKSANASSTPTLEVTVTDKSSTADSTATAAAPVVAKPASEEKDVVLYIMQDTTLQNSNAKVLHKATNGIPVFYVTYPKQQEKDPLTAAAKPEEKVDTVKVEEMRKNAYVPPAKPFKRVIIWGGGRDRYGNFTEECAAHANARLCRAKIYSSGHSYQILSQFKPIINGYNHIELPNLSKIGSWSGKFKAILDTHRKAADYVKENFDLSDLVPGKYYVVNMYYNTITLAVGQTFFSMMLTCMAAYILAKYPFKGSSALYTFLVVCSVVPTFGAEAATFRLMAKTKLRNTYLGMILLCGGMGGPFLYVHSFFKGVPWSFAESAKMDGASDFRIFVQIMIPLAKNGIMVFTIMKFMGYWNEYWIPYLYYHNRPTLAVGLYEIQSVAGSTKEGSLAWSVFFAGIILCVVPVLVAYGFLSDKLMSNLTAGGIKG